MHQKHLAEHTALPQTPWLDLRGRGTDRGRQRERDRRREEGEKGVTREGQVGWEGREKRQPGKEGRKGGGRRSEGRKSRHLCTDCFEMCLCASGPRTRTRASWRVTAPT